MPFYRNRKLLLSARLVRCPGCEVYDDIWGRSDKSRSGKGEAAFDFAAVERAHVGDGQVSV